MFCTKCGNQIKDGFKFCPKCGAPAYVEKEKPQGEVKEVEKVSDEVNVNSKSDAALANKKNVNASQSKTKETACKSRSESAAKTLIEKELDVKGMKKMAEQGDKDAMLRQAFRYEMGIGVDKNKEKSEKLYSKAGGMDIVPELEEIYRPTILPSDH